MPRPSAPLFYAQAFSGVALGDSMKADDDFSIDAIVFVGTQIDLESPRVESELTPGCVDRNDIADLYPATDPADISVASVAAGDL